MIARGPLAISFPSIFFGICALVPLQVSASVAVLNRDRHGDTASSTGNPWLFLDPLPSNLHPSTIPVPAWHASALLVQVILRLQLDRQSYY